MTTFYIEVDGKRWEVGGTEAFMLAEALPGTHLASEVHSSQGRRDVTVTIGPGLRERRRLCEAIAKVRSKRPQAVDDAALEAIQTAMDAEVEQHRLLEFIGIGGKNVEQIREYLNEEEIDDSPLKALITASFVVEEPIEFPGEDLPPVRSFRATDDGLLAI